MGINIKFGSVNRIRIAKTDVMLKPTSLNKKSGIWYNINTDTFEELTWWIENEPKRFHDNTNNKIYEKKDAISSYIFFWDNLFKIVLFIFPSSFGSFMSKQYCFDAMLSETKRSICYFLRNWQMMKGNEWKEFKSNYVFVWLWGQLQQHFPSQLIFLFLSFLYIPKRERKRSADISKKGWSRRFS